MKSALKSMALAAGMLCLFAGLGTVASAAVDVPEIDAGTMGSALTLLSGGMLILTGRRRSR